MKNINTPKQKTSFSFYGLLFAICLLFFVSVRVAVAQTTCEIDTNNYQLIYPPQEDLPCIEQGVPYSATVHFFTPPAFASFTVDSIKITDFLNLPAGLTYTFNPSPCLMKANERGCVLISGTATDSVDYYEIDYNGFVYLTQNTVSFDFLRDNFPNTMPAYTLFVVPQGDPCADTSTTPTNIPQLTDTQVDFSIHPNPNNGKFELKINNAYFTNAEINITDVAGRIIYSQKADTSISSAVIDLPALPKGLYFVLLTTRKGVSAKKISVE